jgi:predicted acyl esterase
LCVVTPDLSARVITSYATRLLDAVEPGEPIEQTLSLRPIAVRVPRGSRLRLTLSGSRFPCYDVNAHTPAHSPATEYADQQVATIEILGATVELPTVAAEA